MGATDSFECKCGTFAVPGELELIRKINPDGFDYLMWIKEGILRFGSKVAKKHSEWGGIGWTEDERQQVLTKYLGADYQHATDVSQMVCGSECGGGTMRAMVDI